MTVIPAGQVTVPAWVSMLKSSMVNPPAIAGRSGIGLITAVCPCSARCCAELAGAVGGVAEHLDAARLAGEQPGGGLGVADVAGGQLAAVMSPVSGSTATCAL